MKQILRSILVVLLSVCAHAQWLQNYSATTVDSITENFTWTSVTPASSAVRFAPSGGSFRSTNFNTTLVSSHSITVTNLLDGTTYKWNPMSKDGTGVQVIGIAGSFTTPLITVTVSPSSVSLTSGGTQQFTATVSGTSNQGVTWSASSGTITTAGLFTAPSVTATTTVTVTATSKVGAKRSGTATVTVNPQVAVQHSVTLNWQDTDPVTFDVYRSTISGSGYQMLASAVTVTNYVDTAVQSGATYYYVVTAVDTTGAQSTYSNEVQAVIP